MSERWLPVPGYDGYEVSDLGQVRSWHPWRGTPVPRILATTADGKGYHGVALCRDRVATTKRVHALVLLAFVGPAPTGQATRHLDGDPGNNALSNLAYGTYSENNADKVRHGTDHYARRSSCALGHPFDAANTYFDGRSGRRCRTCARARSAAYNLKRRTRA